MKLPDNLTHEQSAAIVECLRILARRGEQVLRERVRQSQDRDERAVQAKNAHDTAQKTKLARLENENKFRADRAGRKGVL